MRSDYGMYIVAVICFIIAGAFLASAVPGYTIEESVGQMVIVIFAILGILFAAAGYASRPKAALPTPTMPPPLPAEPSTPPSAEEKVEEAPVTPLPPIEEQVSSIQPTPPPPIEEEVSAISPTPPPPTLSEEEAPTPAPTLEEPARVEEEKPTEKPIRRRRRKKAT